MPDDEPPAPEAPDHPHHRSEAADDRSDAGAGAGDGSAVLEAQALEGHVLEGLVLEGLVSEWLPLPEVALRLETDLGRIRGLLQDHALIAIRRGRPTVLSVPAELLPDDQLMPDLPGTIMVLLDCGFDDVGALTWLLTPDESLPGTPLSRLAAGHKTEIRRRAQALAL